jgi:hypothetical protein
MLYAGIDYTINGNRKLCDAIIKIKFSTVKKPVQIQIYNEILHVNKYPVQLNSISDKFSFYDPGHLLIEGYETTGIKYSIKLVPQHIFLG